MKFNSDLDHYQNKKVWREHRRNFPHTQYSSLNESEKAWLRALNETLRQLEDKFYPILAARHKELQARVADPSDWLLDFNLDCRITFYLREDDPEYEEDDDNILMQIEEMYIELESPDRDPERDLGFGATNVHHGEPSKFSSDELHCSLYHELYDHVALDWRDLFRIGSLYVDIRIEEQSGMLGVNPI